ncbi:hypothetical protein [Streptomyces xanthophaeus]
MYVALGGLSVVSVGIGLICLPLAFMACVSVPDQVRDRRLRARGVGADAVCLERIRTRSVVVMYVRCSFETATGRTMVVTVNTPRPVPELDHRFEIVYDPQDPRTAVARQRLHSHESRNAYILQAVLAVTAVVLAVVS